MHKGFLYFFFSHTDFFPENTDFLVIYTDFVLDRSGRSGFMDISMELLLTENTVDVENNVRHCSLCHPPIILLFDRSSQHLFELWYATFAADTVAFPHTVNPRNSPEIFKSESRSRGQDVDHR